MSKIDVRGYKKAKYRWIILNMFFAWLAITVLVIIYPLVAFIGVFLAVFSGWQMGVLTERNDWDEWYKAEGIRSRILTKEGE